MRSITPGPFVLLCSLAAFVGCKEPQNVRATQEAVPAKVAAAAKAAPVAVKKAPAPLSTRTPHDFGAAWRQIVEAKQTSVQAARSKELREQWRGKRYRWTGATVAGMCRGRACPINVFPRKTDPHIRWLGGFFPKVSLTEDGWDKMRAGCKGLHSCVVTFEGTLAEVVVEPGTPLRLDFENAKVLEARPERSDEGWFERAVVRCPSTEEVERRRKKLRTGRAVEPPAGLVRPRTF